MSDAIEDVVLPDQADAAFAAGDTSSAAVMYVTLLEAEPGDLFLYYRAALLLGRLGDGEGAARHLEIVSGRLAEEGQPLMALVAAKELGRYAEDRAGRLNRTICDLYGRGSDRLDARRRSLPPPLPERTGAPVESAVQGATDPRVLREMALDACEKAAEHWGAVNCVASSRTPPPYPGAPREGREDRRAAPQGREGRNSDPAKKVAFQPLLSELSSEELVSLVPLMALSVRRPGEVVIEQGAEGNAIFILVHGALKVARQQPGGETVQLATLGPGSFFGEMALLTDSPRTARVTCESAALVFEIDRGALERLAAHNEQVATVLANYSRRRLLRNLMATSPLFRLLDRTRRASLVELFESVVLEPGEAVVEEGSQSRRLYVVLTGAVEVTKQEGGDLLTLAELGPGQIFGEISLIKDRAATATVRAVGKTVLLSLSRRAFNHHVSEFPEVLAHIYRVVVEREETNLQLQTSDTVDVEEDLLI